MTALLELLGRRPEDRLVILTCEGLGSFNAANLGIETALGTGVATSAALQVPCPWSRGAVRNHRGHDSHDIGVSLTLNAEYDCFRWGPITRAPSLLDGDGGFPRTADDLGEHADVDEVRRECRAQIERAILWGFDPSHLTSHLDALCRRPELFDVYLDLAVDFALPVSLPDPSVDLGFPARKLAAEEGIVAPDRVVAGPRHRSSQPTVDRALRNLPPGVTEVRVRPSADTPEARAVTDDWAAMVGDAHLVTHDWAFRAALQRSGAELIGFRELREAQRRATGSSAG
ncbi:MAG: ChbG/HpnK family deacetylase [Actinomycetota bacterium]